MQRGIAGFARLAELSLALAQNARRFAHNFAETKVKIPEVHLELSTHRVLTMEFVEGTRFHDVRPLLMPPGERRRVAAMGAAAIFKMAFDDGFFHGDPHPGNLILTPEGNLALLDFGMVGINQGIVSNPAAPFGGIKESGVGREGGFTGIDEFLETKYIGIKV